MAPPLWAPADLWPPQPQARRTSSSYPKRVFSYITSVSRAPFVE